MANRLGEGVWRGARGRCPNCGEGRLFRAYLKVASPCAACGNDNARYPADDGPAYVTILLVGHLVVAPLLAFPFIWKSPLWLVIGATLPALLILILVLLPRIKGAWIGLQWSQALSRAERDALRPGA